MVAVVALISMSFVRHPLLHAQSRARYTPRRVVNAIDSPRNSARPVNQFLAGALYPAARNPHSSSLLERLTTSRIGMLPRYGSGTVTAGLHAQRARRKK